MYETNISVFEPLLCSHLDVTEQITLHNKGTT